MSLDRRRLGTAPRPRGTRPLIAALTVPAVLAAACVPSLQPLYTADDLIADDRILGSWSGVDEDGEEVGRWNFERTGQTAYRLTYVSAPSAHDPPGTTAEPGRFDAHLVELGGTLFLDLSPEELELGNDLLSVHLLPVHTFWTVSFEQDGFVLRYLDPEWLERRIESGSISIRHEMVDDVVVLTAPTAELQRLMTTLASDREAFTDPIVLRPIEPGDPGLARLSVTGDQHVALAHGEGHRFTTLANAEVKTATMESKRSGSARMRPVTSSPATPRLRASATASRTSGSRTPPTW